MICTTATFLVKPGHEKEAAQSVHKMLRKTRTEPGILESQAYRSQRESRRFFIYQQFVSAEAADAHRATADFGKYIMTELYNIIDTESLAIDKYDPL